MLKTKKRNLRKGFKRFTRRFYSKRRWDRFLEEQKTNYSIVLFHTYDSNHRRECQDRKSHINCLDINANIL